MNRVRSVLDSELMNAPRSRRNHAAWIGPLVGLIGFFSYFTVAVRFPDFRDSAIPNLALVIGSEGEGLRHRTREICDGLLEIPMIGGVSSMNAASASAVALFEVVRQGLAATKKDH